MVSCCISNIIVVREFYFICNIHAIAWICAGNFKLSIVLFLLGQWFWMCMLIFLNKFKIHTNFLRKIHKYFSRKACLHYLGSNLSLKKENRVGVIGVLAPLWLLPHNIFFYLSAQEAKTGQYAIEKMHEYELNHPESTPDQRYKVYEDSYYGYANRFNFFKPAAPESIIPNYKSDLASIKDNLEDPYK